MLLQPYPYLPSLQPLTPIQLYPTTPRRAYPGRTSGDGIARCDRR